ncbi:hypothetical protein PNEG_01462 [Pneumocystis murina B123]|uniref:Uncharacterized protein n=1 Tax=Pneumocystis murina (strain B123) TaxID=1069680 RepID=M7PIA1_PNEMU|nr:hypothetical protein PNEG_01462 [Pneumocystis murina B123]EMR10189.1 hypothetical protein PNEG_01462 [Pneumocystis murina B123]
MEKRKQKNDILVLQKDIEFNETFLEKDENGNFINGDKASDFIKKLTKHNVSITSLDFMFIWAYVEEESFLHEIASILEVKKPYTLREWFANDKKFLSLDIRNYKFVNDIKRCVGWDDVSGCSIKNWTKYWLPSYIKNQKTSEETRKNKKKKEN